jgi:glutamine synthetase
MNYTPEEVMRYIEEEDVSFIRLAFRDAFGVQKNISVMPGEMEKAFHEGISISTGGIEGFQDADSGRLYLKPDPSTLAVLPWRPDSGRVVRMFCDVVNTDGEAYDTDTRMVLKKAVEDQDYKVVGIA